RATLKKGIQLVLEKGEREDEQILHSLKLDGVGDDRSCRFLDSGGGCSVHARYGLDALPDLCVDFPAFGYVQGQRVEPWYDRFCPEVLERLDESDETLRVHEQKGNFGDPGLDLRVAHASDGSARGSARSPSTWRPSIAFASSAWKRSRIPIAPSGKSWRRSRTPTGASRSGTKQRSRWWNRRIRNRSCASSATASPRTAPICSAKRSRDTGVSSTSSIPRRCSTRTAWGPPCETGSPLSPAGSRPRKPSCGRWQHDGL